MRVTLHLLRSCAVVQVGIGHSMCLVYTSISIPYLLSAPVGGWIADATGSYWPSIILSGFAAKHFSYAFPSSPRIAASSLFLGSLVFVFFLRELQLPAMPSTARSSTSTGAVPAVQV
jgi:hypothetical protein